MERCSEFIKNKALFGGYPTQEHVNNYEQLGVRYFVDLTRDGERRITPYTTIFTQIRYPITDHRVPSDWNSFAQLVIRLGIMIKSLKSGEKMYVHCKGGHGRSGILVACLLCYMYKLTPSDAIDKTTKYHGRRKEMREKWRRLGSPQTRSQKHFVTKFFEPLIIYNHRTNYFSSNFGNDIDIKVSLPNIGEFASVSAAFKAFQMDSNLRNSLLTDDGEIVPSWDDVKDDIMFMILLYKFQQHKNIRNDIVNTGLRPIIVRSDDHHWGKINNSGRNMLGKMLSKLRELLYME
jgi:hypothetical protein